MKKTIIPLGVIFVIFGVGGAMNFDKSISKPDYFWFFKTNFELEIFLMIIAGKYLVLLKFCLDWNNIIIEKELFLAKANCFSNYLTRHKCPV